MRLYPQFCLVLAFCLLSGRLLAHVGDRPSVHDTVAAIAQRMKQHFTEEQLNALTPHLIEQFLTDEEKSVLAQEHIRFRSMSPSKSVSCAIVLSSQNLLDPGRRLAVVGVGHHCPG